MNAARARTTPLRRVTSARAASSCCCDAAIVPSSSVIRAAGGVDLGSHLGDARGVPRHLDRERAVRRRIGMVGRVLGRGILGRERRRRLRPRGRARSRTRGRCRVSARSLVRRASLMHRRKGPAVERAHGSADRWVATLTSRDTRLVAVRSERECVPRSVGVEKAARAAPQRTPRDELRPVFPIPSQLFHSPARGSPRDPVDNSPSRGARQREDLHKLPR